MILRWLLSKKDKLSPELYYRLFRYYWRVYWGFARLKQDVDALQKTKELYGSERTELVQELVDAYPFNSVLELGCAFGQNFRHFAHWFPEVSMTGIDLDEGRIEAGNEILHQDGFANVQLEVGDSRDLSKFSDKQFDLVYSCASLLYATPDDILAIIPEMVRVCRKRIVLMEQHLPNPMNDHQSLGVFVASQSKLGDYWIRDYDRLFQQIVPDQVIEIYKIPNPIWDFEHWQQGASIIVIHCNEIPISLTREV